MIYVEYENPCLTRGRISTTCVISMWMNYIKCKYMFMLSLKHLARRGLNIYIYPYPNASQES